MGLGTLGFTGLWLTRNAGMEKKMESTIMGYIGTTISIHSCIPSQPTASLGV